MHIKTAYVWGPISNFSSFFINRLLEEGWQVHVACKAALQLDFSTLDLASAARYKIEEANDITGKLSSSQERLVFLESDEPRPGTRYDAVLFMGLPANFDDARVPRAASTAAELPRIAKELDGDTLVFIFSSLWGGIRNDGVVPEELEFKRRNPESRFEKFCQEYEYGVLKAINKTNLKWHLVRLPMMLGGIADGRTVTFTGLYKLLQELHRAQASGDPVLKLNYNPGASFWMLPCDCAAQVVFRMISDSACPVISNVISTQSTINKKWVQNLAKALRFLSIENAENDALALPATLREMLKQSIQVKSHDLFVRYQQRAPAFTSDYFVRILQFAVAHNWGKVPVRPKESSFSAEKARNYFESFLPEKIDRKLAESLAEFDGGMAFQIVGQQDCRWLLIAENGKAIVQRLGSSVHSPQVTFVINPESFGQLVAARINPAKMLKSRALQLSGDFLHCANAFGFFYGFLSKHPFRC